MQTPSFDEILSKILKTDPRYQQEAYVFLRQALDHTQKGASKASKSEARHVSGQELLQGIREFALLQFGPMTVTVLEEWGIRRCEDFGELVFNLVEHGLLSKTEKDSRADFQDGYDFDDAFRKPFQPKQPRPQPVTESSEV